MIENNQKTHTTPKDQPRSPPMVAIKNSPQMPSQSLVRAIESALLDPLVFLHDF
jgi:predicted transcriptional regulator